MIDLINIASDLPHNKFLDLYQKALQENQRGIEAIAISSYDKSSNEVESRFVNLKYITGNEWIFFSNYRSPKAMQFESHDQISALFHWGAINSQIRLKAKINKTSVSFQILIFKVVPRRKMHWPLALISPNKLILLTL